MPEARLEMPAARVCKQEVKRDWAVRREVKEVLRVESSESSWRFMLRRVWEGRVVRSICWPSGEEAAALGGIFEYEVLD